MLLPRGRTCRRTALQGSRCDDYQREEHANDGPPMRRSMRRSMRRRELLLVLTAAMIGARAAHTQQKAMLVIGFLSLASISSG